MFEMAMGASFFRMLPDSPCGEGSPSTGGLGNTAGVLTLEWVFYRLLEKARDAYSFLVNPVLNMQI